MLRHCQKQKQNCVLKMELYLGHVNKQICTLSESASESDSVRCSTSAYYRNRNRNRNRNRSRAVETHHYTELQRQCCDITPIKMFRFLSKIESFQKWGCNRDRSEKMQALTLKTLQYFTTNTDI